MVKKVVAIEDCSISGITEGENYVVHSSDSEIFTILNDRGFYYKALKHKFKPLEEEMEIKVGSEWIDESCEMELKVLFVGEQKALVKYDDGTEGAQKLDWFFTVFKPKPTRRTVWLNVYSNFAQCHKDKDIADRCKDNHVLYQQEVELIDPREGERNE